MKELQFDVHHHSGIQYVTIEVQITLHTVPSTNAHTGTNRTRDKVQKQAKVSSCDHMTRVRKGLQEPLNMPGVSQDDWDIKTYILNTSTEDTVPVLCGSPENDMQCQDGWKNKGNVVPKVKETPILLPGNVDRCPDLSLQFECLLKKRSQGL